MAVEFLVEPFTEGSLGDHVSAAVEAFTAHGLDVELGPFASSSEGEIDAVVDAVASMIRESLKAGASRIRINVGPRREDLVVGHLHDALQDMIRDLEREFSTPASEWERHQKQAAVRLLAERGAFLLRGSTEAVAEVMGVSRITIYNYLNVIEER